MFFVCKAVPSYATILSGNAPIFPTTSRPDIIPAIIDETNLFLRIISITIPFIKIIREVIKNLGMNLQEDDVKKSISVKARDNADMIDIIVKNDDPVVAQKIANETAKVFIENVKQYYKIENLYIYDEAEVENEPYNINHKKDVLIFAVIGIVIALGYVLILNMLDTTIKSAQDIEKISGVTVLASIPIYDLAETKSKGRRGGKR